MEREEEQKVQNTDQNPPTNAGGVEDAGSNLGWGRSLKEEIATCSSKTFLENSHGQRSLAGLGSQRVRDNSD